MPNINVDLPGPLNVGGRIPTWVIWLAVALVLLCCCCGGVFGA